MRAPSVGRGPDPEAVRAAADRAERGPGSRGPHLRPQLSSIEQLPEEAEEDVVWAVGQLNARSATQADILFEFNDRLAAKGIDPISRSAFNRASLKLAAMSKRLAEARRIFEGIAPQFTPERVDENTVALGEFIKLVVFELTQSEGTAIGPKGAMELAKAHLAVIQGQKISADRRRALEADFKAEAGRAIEKVAAAKGLSSESVTALRAELFGQAMPKAEAARGA